MLARMLKDRGVAVIEDVRAKRRDNFAPTEIAVTYRDGSISELLDEAAGSSPCPVALVTDTGRVFVMSSGGSGQIVVVGESSSEQDDAVVAVMDVLHSLWGVKQSGPKKNKSKRAEPVDEVTVEEAAELVGLVEALEEIAQLMPSQNNEETADE